MPKPNKIQMKLAFMKQLLIHASTTAGIDDCVDTEGQLRIRKEGKAKNLPMSEATSQIKGYVKDNLALLQDIRNLRLEIHQARKNSRVTPEQMKEKVAALKAKTAKLSSDGRIVGERVIDSAMALQAEHLSFREMVAISGLNFATVQALTSLANTNSTDPAIKAITQYALSFGFKNRRIKYFIEEMQQCAREEISLLFSGDLSLLQQDQLLTTDAFQHALRARITTLEQMQVAEKIARRIKTQIFLVTTGIAAIVLSLLFPPFGIFLSNIAISHLTGMIIGYNLLAGGLLLLTGVAVEQIAHTYNGGNKQIEENPHQSDNVSVEVTTARVFETATPKPELTETTKIDEPMGIEIGEGAILLPPETETEAAPKQAEVPKPAEKPASVSKQDDSHNDDGMITISLDDDPPAKPKPFSFTVLLNQFGFVSHESQPSESGHPQDQDDHHAGPSNSAMH